jgi:hypothetical protein
VTQTMSFKDLVSFFFFFTLPFTLLTFILPIHIAVQVPSLMNIKWLFHFIFIILLPQEENKCLFLSSSADSSINLIWFVWYVPIAQSVTEAGCIEYIDGVKQSEPMEL